MTVKTYPVPESWANSAWIDEEKYRALYHQSISDPDAFWAEQASRIDWIKPFTKVKNTSYDPHNVSIKWFEDGTLNICANCVDRHLEKRGDQVAIIWEGDEPGHGSQDHIPAVARQGQPPRERAQEARRQEGRPRHDLYADDPRGRLRHAGLRAHRRDPFGGVRRVFRRTASRAASSIAIRPFSSPPTKASAAAARCRSRRMPTKRLRNAPRWSAFSS